MIRNLALQAFETIRGFSENSVGLFTYKQMMLRLIDQFPTYKNMNLKKRLYDVLNIFVALGYLSKQKSNFLIQKTVIEAPLSSPLGAVDNAKFAAKQQKFLLAVTAVKRLKDELNARAATLSDLSQRLAAYRFLVRLNASRDTGTLKPLQTKKKTPKAETKGSKPLVKFGIPLSLFEVDENHLDCSIGEGTVGLVKAKALSESLLFAGIVNSDTIHDN